MQIDFQVFDGDGHILESEDGIEQHYEGEFIGSRRQQGLTIFPSLDGWSRSTIVR